MTKNEKIALLVKWMTLFYGTKELEHVCLACPPRKEYFLFVEEQVIYFPRHRCSVPKFPREAAPVLISLMVKAIGLNKKKVEAQLKKPNPELNDRIPFIMEDERGNMSCIPAKKFLEAVESLL
jgi:hypothetical protein